MKYFYLCFGDMSLRCLNDLISMNLKPATVFSHKTYNYETHKESFYDKLELICTTNNIPLILTDQIGRHKKSITGCDIGVCAGFMDIIKENFFNVPKFGILNIHCGELPYYRGRAPISRTLMDGNDSLFISIHKIDEGVDSGDLLYKKEIIIEEDDDVNSLYYKCSINCASAIAESLHMISMNDFSFTMQDLSLKPKPNQKITEKEQLINWKEPLKFINNKIRALTQPYPGAYTTYKNKKYYFIKSKPLFSIDVKNSIGGKILKVENDFVLIECKDGFLMAYDIRNEKMEKVNFPVVFKENESFIS